MIDAAIDILNKLEILGILQTIAVAIGAMYMFRYFTDKS